MCYNDSAFQTRYFGLTERNDKTMRICVPIPCFFGGMDFCDAIRKVKELGFDAVETYNWKNLDLDRVRETCEETGVELLSMCTTEFNMTNP